MFYFIRKIIFNYYIFHLKQKSANMNHNINNFNFLNCFIFIFDNKFYLNLKLNGDWGIGDWGLGIGDWAQSPIPNPQSPIPNPQSPFKYIN